VEKKTMEKTKGIGFLIGSIISALVAFPSVIVGSTFLIIGAVFSANPAGVDISYQGETLHGAEAVEMAEKLGGIFMAIGGGCLGGALLFGLLFIILLIIFFKKKSA
jgi:hypothetical protein